MKKVKILKYYINPITLNILINKIINRCSKNNSKKSKYICVSSVHGRAKVFITTNIKLHITVEFSFSRWKANLLGSKITW